MMTVSEDYLTTNLNSITTTISTGRTTDHTERFPSMPPRATTEVPSGMVQSALIQPTCLEYALHRYQERKKSHALPLKPFLRRVRKTCCGSGDKRRRQEDIFNSHVRTALNPADLNEVNRKLQQQQKLVEQGRERRV
mmetsp:Transcript_96345/g.144224  ORF Transcript_96345/g.144224 Transcript_96345/m.144224 type:complete len:137 (+) Transcript_96345:61-471(+)